MADYYGKTRTNYFSVTDEEKFKQIMGSCRGADDIEIIDNQQQDGSLKYGFYCEGSIYGLPERDEDAGNTDEEYDDVDYNYDAFCEALQQILPDDDAVLITEVGYEKMRYLIGNCVVITNKDTKYIDINREAVKLAATMLENPDFITQMDY